MNRVLVTGADGFIGSHLVEALVNDGWDVRAFVFYNSLNHWGWLEHSPVKNDIEIVAGDIRDLGHVKSSVRGCPVIMHLAALVGIPYSYHAPESYIDTNIKGTLSVLQAAREFGVERVIHTSSSEVYGTAQTVPISEEHQLKGQSPYAASKVGADQLALSYYYSFGVPISVIRPFNTYGPRQSARAIIPTIITQIAAGNTNLKLGSVSPTRDFNYIQDTVQGFLAMLSSTKSIGEVINIGSGYEVSVGKTAQLIAELMGATIEIQTDSKRLRPEKSEVQRLLADNTKAQNLLNWKPRFSGNPGFRQGLMETIEWFRNPENTRLFKFGDYSI